MKFYVEILAGENFGMVSLGDYASSLLLGN